MELEAAAAQCGVVSAESNVLSELFRLTRDILSRLWTFDQTVALKSSGRFGRGRSERALRSSSKRDSFIVARPKRLMSRVIEPARFLEKKRTIVSLNLRKFF